MNIKYGNKSRLKKLNSYVRHTITKPKYFFNSFKRVLVKDLGCMLVVKDESNTVKHTIESSYSICSRYVVVDKNGDTIPEIKKLQDLYGFDADYYVKPNLDLREAREYALSKIDEDFIIILDGDEVLDVEGLLKMNGDYFENTYLRTKKNVVMLKDMYGDYTPTINNGYHNFFMHNNGTLRIPRNYYNDLPIMSGRGIHLKNPVIWNIHYYKPNHKIWHLRKTYYDEKIQGKLPYEVEEARRNYFCLNG
jgi:hypothetical protein